MNRYLRSEPVCHCWRILLAALFLLLTLGAARGATLVQDFYLPMPESQIYQANSALISTVGATNYSTFSIVVTGDGTQVYYDHWEDGYEVNLASPSQSTTLVWGDGNNANGICPGFVSDPSGIPAGTVIALTNNVPLPRNPAQLLWDARDRVAATKALVISRAAWPIPTGSVFAGAVGVLSTLDYGTNFISPVGQDLTNNLFRYVGMFVMAAQNNTSITVDTNGTGSGTFTVVLNQGESYLINGGIKKGGRITSSKPVQADLFIGHVGASYASDWFTLYPVESWDDTYYTPVSSAASGTQPAYVYLFNPGTNALTISYNTQAGGGSFAIPGTNGVYQFQMPIGSGASFVSANGSNFFALCTVAANNTADTAYNWGFTLVPKAALTTEATVGYGPGSSDGSVNGSPVWVTALGSATLYVDYKGDKAGLLTDPNGNKYDTNFTVVNLQSLKIYDPSRSQTGMRIYTVNGTLLTAAWGEDADRALPGNPYIDAGTTVLPFPTPVILKTAFVTNDVAPAGLSIGDTIQYSVQIDNKGLLPLGNTVVIDAPSTNLVYVAGTTTLNGAAIADSGTGTPFPLDGTGYTIPIILSRGTSLFQYQFQVLSGGTVSNSVNIGGTTISANANIPPSTSTNGVTVKIRFTDTSGTTVALYAAGTNVFVTLTNAVGNTASNTIQTLLVTVFDATSGDSEAITLTETSTNSGVFRNTGGLPTSLTSGVISQDGTLKVSPGDVLNVSYTEPVYGSSSSATAAIQIPAQTKQLYFSVNGSTNGVQALNRLNPVALGNATTRTSADIGSGGGGGSVTTDATAASNTGAATNQSLTVSHTTGVGANRIMIVGVAFGAPANNTTLGGVSNVMYGATQLTRLTNVVDSANRTQSELWYLLNPTSGSANVVVNMTNNTQQIVAGVTTFAGVNQATPFGPVSTNWFGTTVAARIGCTNVVTSAANELVYQIVSWDGNGNPFTNAPAAGQTQLWSSGPTTNAVLSGASTQPGSASPSTNWWTLNTGRRNSSIALSIKPAAGGAGGPATNVTSFTQAPVFASAFTMPSNNFVTITNYITLTNGSFTANPDVTARLQYGGANFLTLTSPAYSATSNTLVWSAVLTTNLTIPSSAAITCVLSNGVVNTAFHVNYDSTNAPSKITLPASTVIAISTFAVYDAPYPGGSLVTTPVAGSTLYVRAVVTDPFGSYDITSLGLAFTAPSTNNNFNVTLTNSSVVATNAATKTYEYTWSTGAATGNYAIAATANEGTEGVTASASAGITTIFLDLGTPSTTEFTSGNNGSATNSYLANSTVCFRVSDLNRNTNSSATESILATVTSTTGDSEIVTLTETGTNSGVFTACISTVTNTAIVPNDGTLVAAVGAILTVSYVDSTDASDSTSATATIQPLPGVPGIAMNKTIVSPSGGQVGVNQPVIYNLQVVNTGSTVLTNVSITDTFSANRQVFTSASVTPSTTNSTTLTWTNFGNFAPGQSTNITVNFTTTATGTATNSARATSTAITNSSVVSLTVNSAALNVVKILMPPTNQPVSVGSNVTFRITIQNVGNTTITYLPFQDTFSGAYYQYVSATIPTNAAGFGTLIWTNLAATPLLTNAIITNDVTMRVIGAGTPANNTATADFATDIFGNAVPAASSTIGVNTATASIIGHVYNDINQSGVFTNGDAGLNNVTLQLFTDPNGDGNPADGTLVQISTTDGNGYYELLNLTQGRYVVVETDLPGYVSSAPVNNRLSLNLTNLVAFTNNNFFDYVPAPSVYSTFSGKVFNDTNGFGTNTAQAGLGFVSVDLVSDVNSNGVADLGEPVTLNTTTDSSGNYSIANIAPGYYVLRETDNYGYYSSGDSQAPNNNQIFFRTTNAVVLTNNYFFDRLSPTANADTNVAFLLVATPLSPLTNDVSPNGDALIITNATATGGTVVINSGSTNLTFTPTNLGTATIIYTIADAHGGTNSTVITVTVTELANLAIGKTAAASVLASGSLTYTISVTNLGPTPASSVTVTDTLPTTVSFVSASGNGVNNSGLVTWSLGTLAANGVTNLTVIVTAPASGSLTNFASVGSPTPDPTPTNNTTPPVITTVTPQADVSLVKTGPAGIIFGTNYNYSITVSNGGPSTATSLIVTDSLPIGLVFVTSSPLTTTNASNQVIWNLGNLLANSASNLTLTVISTQRGSLTNFASGGSPTGDPIPTNNVTPPVVTLVTNFPPLANPDSYAMTENTSSTLTPLVNDVLRTPGGSLAIISFSATNGSASLLGGTNFNFTPTLNFTGTATIGYTITDNVGGTNSAVITISVTNIPPIANPDSGSMTENSTNTFSPLGNDSVQNPGGTLSITGAGTTNGTVSFTSTTVTFTPTNNFIGTTLLTYSISDGIGGTSSSTITVTVTNIPPLANPDGYTVFQNSTNTFSPLTNDVVRTPGGTLVIISVSPTNGSATISGTNIIFTPMPGFTGTATIGYTITDSIGGTNSTVITVNVQAQANLAVTKTGAASVYAATNFDYTITVTNFGPGSAASLSVTDSLPSTVSFVSASAGGTFIAGQVIWANLGSLAANAATNLTVTVTAPLTSQTLTNFASGGSPTSDPNPTNNTSPPVTTTVTPIANLAIGKTGAATVLAVSNLNYTITVTNFGPSSASSVTVTDALPVGVTFVSATGGGVTNGSSVIWNLGTLSSNQVSSVTLTVTAPASGSLTNVASVGTPTLDPTPTNNVTPPVITTVTPLADVVIAKTGPALVSAASSFSYTISVTNFGPSSASSVTVTDTLPVGITFSNASAGGVNVGGTVIWNLGTMTAAQATNLTLTVTAPNNGTTLTNVANVSSPTGDTNVLNNTTPPVVTTVTPVADVSVLKTGPAGIIFGTNYNYQITVSNGGPSTATSLIVTDSLPSGLAFVSSVPSTTTNASNEVIWNLGSLLANTASNLTLTVISTQRGSLTNFASGGSPTPDPTPTNNVTPPVVTLVTNFPPLANPDGYTVLENSTNTFSPLTNDVVRNPGGTLSIISVTPTNGAATISGTNVIFTPTNNFVGTATIGYTITDSVGGTNSSVITVTVLAVADIAVSKTGAASVYAATNFDYTITVTNFGPGAAASLSVTDSLPSSVSFVSASAGGTFSAGQVIWANLGSLAANAATNLTVTVTAPLTSQTLTNMATAGTPTSDPNPTNNTSPPVTTTVTPIANVAIGKVGPATVFAVSNLTYTISVTNFGPSSASSVTVTDALPAGVTFVSATGGGATNGSSVIWNLGTLSSNQTSNVTVTVTAPASGSLTNVASVGTPTLDPTPTNNVTPPVITTVTDVADLKIGKIGAASVFANSNLSYTISVTNFGPSSASSVTVTDALPVGVTFVSASSSGVNNFGTVNWSLGTLSSNQVTNVTVTVTAPASGTLTNTASVSTPTGDPNPTNNVTPPVTTSVTPLADLQIGKVGPATVFAISNLTYTISVTNFGPSSASSVTVTDALPNGVTFVSATGGGVTNGNLVSWSLGTLVSNQTSSVTVTVTAPASGSLTNTATVNSPTGDPSPTNNVTPPVVTTVTLLADVSVLKTGPAGIIFGTNYNYSITVSNGGPSTATSLIVTDSLPVGLAFVSSVPSATTNASSQVIWNLGNFAANTASNLTLTVISTQRGSLTNFASGGSPTPDPTPTNNVTPPVVTLITNFPPLANPDSASMTENTTNTVSPLFNDLVRTPGGSLTILSVTPTNGAASISGTNVIFVPTLNFIGVATIGYVITDNVGGTNISVITITVTNIPPLANPDSYSMAENTTNTFSPTANDTLRTIGGTLALVSLNPTNGTATISGTNVIFTPTVNFLGIATIGYTITDSIGGTNSSLITINVTNRPPVANPDSYAMTENTTNSLPVMVNDVLVTPGGALTIVSVTPTNGTASISGTNIIFVPTTNFLGTATIGYTITDGIGGTNSSVATVTVTNIPPLANPDSYTMAENTTNTFSPLTNDVVRTPGGSLIILSVTPTNGAANIIGGTNVTFIPTINFVGVTTIGYTITDGIGGTNSSVITVTVTNQSPLAFPQTLSTTENVALPITLTGLDPVSRPLTFIIVSAPSGGTLTGLNTNTGAVTYTPTNNFTGTDTFVFRVNNGVNNSSNATITINVTPTADLLVQQSGPTSGVAGNNLLFTVAVTNLGPASATNVVVTNRIDAGYTFVSASANGATNGSLVTWIIPTLPANGATNLTVTLLALEGGTFTNVASGSNTTLDLNAANNNGSLTNAQVVTTVSASANLAITKTAPANVNATGSLTYNLSVTNGGPSTATGVIVTDALPASVSFVTASGNGVNNSGIVTWNLGTLANGATSNLTVTVNAAASGTLTNFASIGSPTPDPTPTNNITPPVITTVTTIADLAVGKSGAASSALGVNFTYTISVTNLGPSTAANFAVTDSLPAGIVFVSAVPSITTNAASQVIWTNLGTLALNATTNFTLTVKAVTRGAVTNFATVGGPTVDGTPTNNTSAPVVTSITNRPPLAVDDSGSTPKNVAVTVSVLVNDSDPDGDALTIISVSPTNGTANIVGTNVVFTPALNFLGTAFIGYTITDGFGGTNSALITINVTNRPPVAVNDSASTPKNIAVTIPVLANDSDVDGDTLTIISVAATNGFAVISGTNVVFTPTNNFLGTTFIGYTISDGNGGTSAAVIAVLVTNRAPVAVNDFASTPKNVLVSVPVLVNDSDPDGDPLTIFGLFPTNGVPSVNGNGTNIDFVPANNFVGVATVGYRIIDGFGGSNTAIVFITVTNRPPVATNDFASTPKNVAVTIPVLANDGDPDGDALTIISVSPTNGTASIVGTNVVFTPTNNFLGVTTVGYRIIDGFGGTNSALITVTVTNRAPIAVDDSRSTAKNIAVTIPALANDSDPDGDTLTIVSVNPTNGTANIGGTNVIFTPATNFFGTATIGYAITDGFGGTNSALITVTVTNRAPVANAQSTNTTFNTGKALTLTGSDPDGDALTFSIVSSPVGGTLTGIDTNTGAVIYTPTNNFTGTDSFTFRVNDGTADSASAAVSITVGTPIIADLAVFKTGPTSATAGSNLVYSITVTNLGTSAATNVVVSDTLPAGFIFVSATPTNSSLVGSVVNWSVFKLAANAKTNFTLTARSLEGGTFTNFATAISDAYDPNPTNNNGSLTNSQARTTIAASADVQVFKDGGTNVAAGSTVNYTITATNAGPSTATDVVVKDNLPAGATFQTASGSYTFSNNVVTWSALTLTNGASVNFTLALTAPASGQFTNIALATSPTPDPNLTNNNGSLNKSRVATKIVPVADLIVLLYGPTNAVQGSNFVYSLILSNAGPSVASNAFASDQLPTNFVFVSATSGGVFSNGVVKWPKIAMLAVGGTSNYFITVNSPFTGTFTNIASAISDTLDPNPTNNTGVAPASQALTTVSVADLSWLGGTPIFNPQTGLYEETVIVTNNGNGTIAGFWLYVTVLTPNVQLWNATGTNGGVRYVQYSSPLDPSNHVSLVLEFYDPLRVPFTNTLLVVPVIPANIGGIGTNGSVNVEKIFTDVRTNGTRFVIEFASVPGKTYTIIYSGDLQTWKVATPSVTANANVTQWYDDGPPKTESLPTSVTSRFYRVIKN